MDKIVIEDKIFVAYKFLQIYDMINDAKVENYEIEEELSLILKKIDNFEDGEEKDEIMRTYQSLKKLFEEKRMIKYDE